MIYVVNFANELYKSQQQACTESAYRYGKVDKVIEYSEKDLPDSFFKDNPKITSYKRGFGLWLWKPYLILKAMDNLNDGDILFYVDSGITFINNIHYLLPYLQRAKDRMLFFEYPLLNEDWTKGETFKLCNYKPISGERQLMGLIILLVVSDKSKEFIKEWYNLCRQEQLISPYIFDESIPNGINFTAHREDQSILSIHVRYNNMTIVPDPSDYGEFQFQYKTFGRCNYMHSRPYPTIILCNRKVNSKAYKRKYLLKRILHMIGLYNEPIVNLKRNIIEHIKI